MTAKLELEKFIKDLNSAVRKSFDRASMLKIGTYLIDVIKQRTRAGFGVPDNGKKEKKLAPLTAAYIKQRRRMRLSRFTTPGTSNLTRSGRLLSSLRLKGSKLKVSIEPTGTNSNGVANDKIALYQEEQGRVFLRLSKNEIEDMQKFIDENILDKNTSKI